MLSACDLPFLALNFFNIYLICFNHSNLCLACNMDHQIFIGYSLDYLDVVAINDDINSRSSGVGRDSSLGLSESSHFRSVGWVGSIEIAFCQCKDEDSLVECLICGSYFELDTFCPWC
jgi:hypothetical protein